MKPLAISDTPWSQRTRPWPRRPRWTRCRPAAAGCAASTSRPPRWAPGWAWSTASTTLAWPAGAGGLRLPQQPPGRTGPARRRLCRRAARARTLRRRPHRRLPGHQHLGHPADRAGLPPARPRHRCAARRPALRRDAQHLFGGALRAPALGLQGPAAVVSTACSSSAKVFGQAARHDRAGPDRRRGGRRRRQPVPDHAVRLPALELVSPEICRPWDAQRKGLSIGEAAAFALLERDAARRWPGCWAAARAATATT
jgi:hypothetical protein